MSLASGLEYLAIPGPSVMPEAVLRAMHRPAPNIYEGELVELTQRIIPRLKHVAQTDGYATIYMSNGHGAWEAALANIATRDDRILVAATGRFAHGWAEMARRMGIEVDIFEFGDTAPIDPQRLQDHLSQKPSDHYRAVLITHVDTSTSIKNDVARVRDAMAQSKTSALLAVDCIASLGCDRFLMDDWGVDVMVASCQKGLMVPPGLAFVFFNERAAERQRRLEYVSMYWDWAPRANPELFYQHFCGTAPTHHLFGLDAALTLIETEGLDNVIHRHETLARAIWTAAGVWGQNGALRMNVEHPNHRSHAVTALRLNAPDGTRLRHWTQTQAGLTLGIGLGMSTPSDPQGDGFFRFGHMGHVNAHMIMGLLGTVQAGFVALDIEHGCGALDAAARVIAQG